MNTPGDVLLEARVLCKELAGRRVVDSVSFNVARGEVVGLLGTNGAGKSTTLQMLAGMSAPTSGQVLITGHDVYRGSRRVLAAIGYLPDVPPLYPELTVDEYLRHVAALRGVTRGTIAQRVDQVKLQFDLLQVGRQIIGKLSRGFQQRVGLAQALVHQPSVVIMDEPTLGLDPLQTAVMRRCIVALRAQAAVILSSHHLSDVQAMCGRVVILRDGCHAYSGAVPLRNGNASDRTRVVLRQAPVLAAVRAAPGVLAAEQLDEMTFHLTLLDGDMAPELFVSHAVGSGWRLAELRTETRSLEETFAAIVGREPLSSSVDRLTH